MTVTSGGRDLFAGRLSLPTAALLLLSAAGAWIAIVALSDGMGAMPGTMGLGVIAFVGVWTLMMAAMMLPGVVPFASATVPPARPLRSTEGSFLCLEAKRHARPAERPAVLLVRAIA